jgi:flagellar motility protein MotE (MotC chaperone)
MKCFNCGAETSNQRYEITICPACEQDLRLFTDETIARQKAEYKTSEKYAAYGDEIADRLVFLEKDYLKKKIKLLHVLERLEHLKY